MREEWLDIIGYEDRYQVSNMGKVKSLNYNHTGKERLLKPRANNHGYLYVILCKDGKVKSHTIHRLVGQAFLTDYSEELDINHCDGCKTNNMIENLEMITHKENITHAWKSGLRKNCQKTVEVIETVSRGKAKKFPQVRVFDSVNKAAEYLGCHKTNVSSCARGKQKTCKECLVEYVDIEKRM